MACKSNVVSNQKSAYYISLGKQRARWSWSSKARHRYGWRYRKWSSATDRGYYITVDGNDLLLFKIRAYARPCR